MSGSLLAGALWVLAATATAMLKMRHQYVPGVTLLLLAPVILVWIGRQHGVWVVLLCLAAFASMMRNPLRYFYKRLRGERPEIPK